MPFFDDAQKAQTLSALTHNELGDILEKGERAGVSWEIHTPTFFRFPAFSRRFFFLGKEIGVHFAVGTDAHTLAALSTAGLAERIKAVLSQMRI